LLQKYRIADLLNVCALYETQNADNARTLTTKAVKFMQQTTSSLSEGDRCVCN